ncbi:MAG TPA: DUF418 domain-containing protein [Novosphingobium sp.]|nr:DUF418 domain-containing protein [Novosphingobium sp.]
MDRTSPDRIAALDLIRGVAVLGILTVNIAGFAGPTVATLTPHVPAPGSFADEAAFATVLVLFEGKMRALFTLLFGASMLLFIDRAEQAGRNGDVLQLRRLVWLVVLGYLHFVLLWWGDILFLYAVAGLIALFFRHLPVRRMLFIALLMFGAWQAFGLAESRTEIRTELAVLGGSANPSERAAQLRTDSAYRAQAAGEIREYRSGFVAQIAAKLETRPFYPVTLTLVTLGETLPWILIGMALYRLGLFGGLWPRAALQAMAVGGILGGGVLTLAFTAWAWTHRFPTTAMREAIAYGLAVPHLLVALGYAAALMLAAPRLLRSRLGQRIGAAGRMAFSNYIGTTLVMCALFYGWGLGLVGQIPHAVQPLFVLLGWTLMLGWSEPWLTRFRQGPLEWLWRSLTERRALPFKR